MPISIFPSPTLSDYLIFSKEHLDILMSVEYILGMCSVPLGNTALIETIEAIMAVVKSWHP